MKWVTREKARVDRIACPWLIRKFVDPEAEFLYVPKDVVMHVVSVQGAIPFDTPGAELHHYEEGERSTSVSMPSFVSSSSRTPRSSSSRRLSV